MRVIARTLVLGSCLMAAALVATPRSAEACGMGRMPVLRMNQMRADELLAEAGRKIEQSQWPAASRLANQVAESKGPRPEQRAAALAIVGWAAWQAGAQARALTAFRRARLLDAKGEETEKVLAKANAAEKLKALRAALNSPAPVALSKA
jgi:hypothetical protein